LLLRALDDVDAGEGPWAPELRADAARCRAQAAIVLPTLAELGIRPLVDAGFEPVVMKGAALSARYPAPGLRPMDDVDVLLPAPQVGAAVATLEANGWARQAVPGRHHHEVVLTHRHVPGLPIEVHARFSTWHEQANHLSPRRLWARRQPREIAGVPAFVFAPEDELVALASHAAKPFHVFARLLWAVDVAVVIASGPLDWDRVRAVAKESSCRTALAVALTQAERLGAESPIELRTSPATGTRRTALEPVLSAEWPVQRRDFSTRDRLRYALVDDPALWVLLLGESIIEEGAVHSVSRAARTSRRFVHRWRALRRTGQQLAEEVGHAVEP
jgi:hypothetical protein